MLKSKYKRQRLVHCVHILIGDYSHITATARYGNSSKCAGGWGRGSKKGGGGKDERERQSKREREAERGRRKRERVGRREGRKEQLKWVTWAVLSRCAVRAWERNLNLFGPNFYASLKFLCIKVSIFQIAEPLNECHLLQLVLKHRNN